MNQIFVKKIALPAKVKGMAVEIQDDFFIFVNENLSLKAQHCAADHELRHVKLDHFYNEDPVVINELEVVADL